MPPKSHQDAKKLAKTHIGLVEHDSFLLPYEEEIEQRQAYVRKKLEEVTENGEQRLSEFANGHHYYGLHLNRGKWTFREWLPNATKVFLVGDFNQWQQREAFEAHRIPGTGDWELVLPEDAICHQDHYKMFVYWDGGCGERLPAWARRVVQDPQTHIFSAQAWLPEQDFQWKEEENYKPQAAAPLLIYECHVGMAQDAETIGTYTEFKEKILPRIIDDGYNCIQLMAIQEHPYYASFGYHVGSFFAPSSRFGTPEELKSLIEAAHENGISVIMDLVHSHAVKNEVEGLGLLAGDKHQFFCQGQRRVHPVWDSLCFDYGKNEVLHFLLSNCKYWMEEFHFDGFRFDGVTSMLYYDHGINGSFMHYDGYFNGNQYIDAISYLTLANLLIHELNPSAMTIAEEVSGMPGVAAPFADGGMGFDYRLAMNIPDYWVKIIKELPDEHWKMSSIFWEMKNRRPEEKTISYCESHDQALVGDKTIIFRLVDSDMYWHFKKGDETDASRRGIALHKMIRLATIAAINGGYLNFMGNEFGHPEWIDFPRAENRWSHLYARRQWHLTDDPELCYHWLGDFDKAMLKLVKSVPHFAATPVQEIWHSDEDQILCLMRGDLVFTFNFNPTRSFADYGFLVPKGEYGIVLNTDAISFGGNGLAADATIHQTIADAVYEDVGKEWLRLYIPARSAVVLIRINKFRTS